MTRRAQPARQPASPPASQPGSSSPYAGLLSGGCRVGGPHLLLQRGPEPRGWGSAECDSMLQGEGKGGTGWLGV